MLGSWIPGCYLQNEDGDPHVEILSKLLVRLRKSLLVRSCVWGVIGSLYLLPSLCLSPKCEVSGLWEKEEWCNRGREGWSEREEDLEQCREAGAGLGRPGRTIGFVPPWRAVGN